MFHMPNYVHNVSLGLSNALRDIGLNEKIMIKRRRARLLAESMCTVAEPSNIFIYNFGSQSEGTTTPGLDSDCDILRSENDFNLIQEYSDWELGKRNFLTIQDETVSPGYCLLQLLKPDSPVPTNDLPDQSYFRDKKGRVLIKNTLKTVIKGEGRARHGPADTLQGPPDHGDVDRVPALPCKTWTLQGRLWLDQQFLGQWPSDGMKRFCRTSGFFCVPVGKKGSGNEEIEWRISTSLAERCLMFNLSITQIHCYVLMKMIIKCHIKPQFGDAISSFMCKTVLFHCIANTYSYIWRENNLLGCLSVCLSVLFMCVSSQNCPHFIIPRNNLMAGHITPEIRLHILEILRSIVTCKGRKLLEIGCDLLGLRLQAKLNRLYGLCPGLVISGEEKRICGDLLYNTAYDISLYFHGFLRFLTHISNKIVLMILTKLIFRLVVRFSERQGIDKTACRILAPFFCATLGSVLASHTIHLYNNISQEAFTWISLGLNTDASSGKLKLASVFYCIGDIQRTESLLRNTREGYDLNVVEPMCRCHNFKRIITRKLFDEIAVDHDEEAVQNATAFCVRFLPCEINCIPKELKYDMFRSLEQDLPFRGTKDFWMDWAVVDSLPYLYFLQYKTYGHLERQEDKERALSNLVWTIEKEQNLGHRETALNLLGQCMEQEDRAIDALFCYSSSLNLRGRNNAAKFHICRLLSALINH